MKYAVVNSERVEAQPGLSGECPSCGRPALAKCGEIKIWHWAHLGKRDCDPWKENETEWHRNWKGHFPVHLQEVVHTGEGGEKHRADVKTAHGRILEFQHSLIAPEERRAREEYYKKMAWVVNGSRRKRDENHFFEEMRKIDSIKSPNIRGVFNCHSDSALLRDWGACRVPVFFDFSQSNESGVFSPSPQAALVTLWNSHVQDLLPSIKSVLPKKIRSKH